MQEFMEGNKDDQQILSKPSNQKHTTILLLGTVVLVLILLSGMVAYFIRVRTDTDVNNQLISKPTPTIYNYNLMLTPTIEATTPLASMFPAPTIDLVIADWKTYALKPVGLELKLPIAASNDINQLKEQVLTPTNGGLYSGSIYNAVAKIPNGSVDFQADSTDSSDGRSALFTDLVGYSINNGQYFTKYHSSDGYRPIIIPNENIIGEITNPYGVHILKIKNTPSTINNFIFMNTSVGALINTPSNTTYPGIVFQMNLSGNLNEKVFDQILSTFRLTN